MRGILFAGVVVLLAGCSRSTDDWLRQMKEGEVVKRREAIRELGQRTGDGQRIVPALTEALRDDNNYVRRDAARTLGKFEAQAREAAPALLTALQDKDSQVRAAAAAALKKIDAGAAAKAGVR